MTDQASEGLLSPFLRRQRMRAAQPLLGGKVLDIGCGAGHLARYVVAADYVGIDRDLASLELARKSFPEHRFVSNLSEVEGQFDTVVALAVIEHVADPAAFLQAARQFMVGSGAAIILTTPHPSVDWVHDLGARVGLFSSHASEEHEALLDGKALSQAADRAGLRVDRYRRFLFGANQIAVLTLP